MGSVGDAYDNAMCESFFATLECELLARRRFKTQAEARMALFQFIEGFYNRTSLLLLLDRLPLPPRLRAPAFSPVPTRASLPARPGAAVKDKPFRAASRGRP